MTFPAYFLERQHVTWNDYYRLKWTFDALILYWAMKQGLGSFPSNSWSNLFQAQAEQASEWRRHWREACCRWWAALVSFFQCWASFWIYFSFFYIVRFQKKTFTMSGNREEEGRVGTILLRIFRKSPRPAIIHGQKFLTNKAWVVQGDEPGCSDRILLLYSLRHHHFVATIINKTARLQATLLETSAPIQILTLSNDMSWQFWVGRWLENFWFCRHEFGHWYCL